MNGNNDTTKETEPISIENYLLTLEDQFYQEGLSNGLPHGQLHGIFEGRALGREKGWELWEEVGHYEGVALFWRALLMKQDGVSSRALTNVEQILKMVSQFPTKNDSSLLEPGTATDSTNSTTPSPSDVDIPVLLTSIRSKYRATCASLGMRARIVASAGGGEGSGDTKMSL